MHPQSTALVLADLQNDFMHPDGAYARGGVASPYITALPERVAPLCDAFRGAGAWIVSTHFTLVPGKHGEPFISEHLRTLRPFLRAGDFAPGSFGQALIEPLGKADISVEKVAYSAFYMSRLEWVLQKAGIEHLVVAGIVTNGGVASTVRDAHVRDFGLTVLDDGCATYDKAVHDTHIAAMASIADIKTCREMQNLIASAA